MAAPLRVERLVIGAGFMALGVVWLLGNLGALDVLTTLRRWWPLSLVFWGALELTAALIARARRSA